MTNFTEIPNPLRLLSFSHHLTRGASHRGLVIHIKKYLKAKEELQKLKYFTMPKYNLQKNPMKETQILQEYHNSITANLKFQHKPKYHLSKILIEK